MKTRHLKWSVKKILTCYAHCTKGVGTNFTLTLFALKGNNWTKQSSFIQYMPLPSVIIVLLCAYKSLIRAVWLAERDTSNLSTFIWSLLTFELWLSRTNSASIKYPMTPSWRVATAHFSTNFAIAPRDRRLCPQHRLSIWSQYWTIACTLTLCTTNFALA